MRKLSCLIIIFILSIGYLYAAEKERIAVLDFSAKGVPTELSEAIVENLTTELVNSNSYEVIERNQLQKLMKELSLQNSDDFNDKLRSDLGNLYGVNLVILGSITKIGSKYTTNVRGVEVSTGVVKFAKNFTTSKEDEIPDLIPQLVNIITGKEVNNDKIVLDDKKNDAKKTVDNTQPLNKFQKTANLFKTLGGSFTGLAVVCLVTGFISLGLQYYFVYRNQNPDSGIMTASMDDLNNFISIAEALQAVRNTFLITGSILLSAAISFWVVYGVFNLKAKNAMIQIQIDKNKKIALNFDLLLYHDKLSFECKFLF